MCPPPIGLQIWGCKLARQDSWSGCSSRARWSVRARRSSRQAIMEEPFDRMPLAAKTSLGGRSGGMFIGCVTEQAPIQWSSGERPRRSKDGNAWPRGCKPTATLRKTDCKVRRPDVDRVEKLQINLNRRVDLDLGDLADGLGMDAADVAIPSSNQPKTLVWGGNCAMSRTANTRCALALERRRGHCCPKMAP